MKNKVTKESTSAQLDKIAEKLLEKAKKIKYKAENAKRTLKHRAEKKRLEFLNNYGHEVKSVKEDISWRLAHHREVIIQRIMQERLRQSTLHPETFKSQQEALMVLAAEFGEVATAVQKDPGNIETELIQVAAVCVKWLEHQGYLDKVTK